MFRLIAAIVMIMMPVISVSNGGSEDSGFISRDPFEDKACDPGDPTCGPPSPFQGSETFDN